MALRWVLYADFQILSESIDQPESDMELGHPPHNDDKESEGTRELNKASMNFKLPNQELCSH